MPPRARGHAAVELGGDALEDALGPGVEVVDDVARAAKLPQVRRGPAPRGPGIDNFGFWPRSVPPRMSAATPPARAAARRHVLRFDVAAETLATFREAMVRLRRDTDEPLDDDAALLLMARAVLGGPADAGRSSYQIAMTECERCRAGTQHGRGEAVDVEPAIVEMAECDAQHVADGKRASQTIPPATRRAVVRRDGGCCAVPGCRNAVYVDLHHVDPRAEGGGHDPEHLLLVCSAHHRAVHRGRLIVAGRASTGFTFQHADGSAYGSGAAPERVDVAARVFLAMRGLGFKEKEARRAIADAASRGGADADAGASEAGETFHCALRRGLAAGDVRRRAFARGDARRSAAQRHARRGRDRRSTSRRVRHASSGAPTTRRARMHLCTDRLHRTDVRGREDELGAGD